MSTTFIGSAVKMGSVPVYIQNIHIHTYKREKKCEYSKTLATNLHGKYMCTHLPLCLHNCWSSPYLILIKDKGIIHLRYKAYKSEAESLLLKLPVSESSLGMAFRHIPNPHIFPYPDSNANPEIPTPILSTEACWDHLQFRTQQLKGDRSYIWSTDSTSVST